MKIFSLVSRFKPAGDQPEAISKLVENLTSGTKYQMLLGVTGSGKTFTIANVIAKTKLMTLIIEPNKTLAAQIYEELLDFFPKDRVHYFVSYYDYYQPEAYIPHMDTYIEKDAKINDAIDQLRHAATSDVLSAPNTIIVASVSCIYGIGDPETYKGVSLDLKTGEAISRRELISRLVGLQYSRNDYTPARSEFRLRGDTVEIWLPYGTEKISVVFLGNKIYEIKRLPLPFKNQNPRMQKQNLQKIKIFPAKHFVTRQEKLAVAIQNIRTELAERIKELKNSGKLLEAERVTHRTNYDLELLEESGYCPGIENYSRHLSFRKPGRPPYTLIDYFPKNFLTVIDESHVTIPQIQAMASGERKRKEALINFGFRLPSAIDNRPLTLQEFEKKISRTIYVSATPGVYEWGKTGQGGIIQQLIRPTGIIDPVIKIRPAKNQIKNLLDEIRARTEKKERVLVLTLTKRLAEDMAEHLAREKIKVHWMHSEIKTLLRPEILTDLRKGKVDVLVGVNLLREGLDLPEVSLVAILDADKEGFLRNETTLIQAMGRTARHIDGSVILYADKMTSSMESAIIEVNRRRKIQKAYNKTHKIIPKPIIKEVRSKQLRDERAIKTEFWRIQDIKSLEREIAVAAGNLDFERAARLRDLINNFKNDKQKKYGNN